MFVADIKYAVRLLSKKPGFSVLTIVVMATGIGLSLFLFSFLNTIMFKPLPFKDGASLIQVSASQNGNRSNHELDLHDFAEIRKGVNGLSEWSSYRALSMNVSGRDGTRRYVAVVAEHNFFSLTRTKPIIGRDFTPDDNLPGSEHVTVIGFDMWQSQFASDPNVLGAILRINGQSTRIVGVMPKGYYFPEDAELWLASKEDASRSNRGSANKVLGLAHLNDGWTMQQIDAQLDLTMKRLEQRYPQTNSGISAYVETLQKASVGDGIVIIYALYVVAVLILLLASINVSNLLLSRAIERSKETAIRVALGAPKTRLVSQMLWESVIICGLGGVLGLILLSWGLGLTQTITASFFSDKPRFWWQFGLDAYTISLFTVFVIFTIVVTGLLPALKNAGADFNHVLRDGTRGALSKRAGRLNRFLVIVEIFISIVILIAASVAVFGTHNALNADYGSKTEKVLTAKLVLPESKYDTPEKRVVFLNRLESLLDASPAVGDVMLSSSLPGEFADTPAFAIEGQEYVQGAGENVYPRSNSVSVSTHALERLGVELKNGRYFNVSDEGQDKRTVIVTDSFAERYFPNESPLGKRIRFVSDTERGAEWLTIVGVVEHTIQGLANRTSRYTPSIFRPLTQTPPSRLSIAMTMQSNENEMAKILRSTLSAIDQDLPAYRIETYNSLIERNIAPLVFITSIFVLLGIAAAILAASGIYGVMANTIVQRSQEIGVKRALGAAEQRIMKEYLLKSLVQLAWGGVPGLILGAAMGAAMASILASGNSSAVVITTITVPLFITVVVLLATYIPVQKILIGEPVDSLRSN